MRIFKLSAVLLLIISLSASAPLSLAGDNDRKEMIAFNFVDVEIPTVIKFISEITGYNFLFDERIKGKITIIAPTKLSVDESFSLFTSILSLKGYTVVAAGPKIYKIIPSSLAKQEGIISTDETFPVNEGYITKLIPLENIRSEEALQFLRPIVSRDGHISAFGPRNLLLVVDSAMNIDKIMSILKLIDKPTIREDEANINVFFLEHADATELAKVLQGIIRDLQTSYKTARRDKQQPASQETPVLSVTPDKATNALVIVAPPDDYERIAQVIRTLDKRRKQVYVEAMIVEASVEKLQALGSKWRVIGKHKGEPVVIGGFGNISSTDVLSIITGLSGFSAGGMGNFLDIPVTSIGANGSVTSQTLTSPGFAALFSLDEFKDTVNVLSTPQILTSDNEEAEILVGENVPFISQRERDVTTTNTVLNSIERTDVGIKLKLTPQISEGDYVRLNIFQEISAVKETSADVLVTVGPTTTKRSTKTSVVVKDGRTVVIGGLMQERDEEGVEKTPILGDIPLLGWFFKYKSVSKNKTNLLVFLSPHIVKEQSDLVKITDEKYREFSTKEKFYMPGELLLKFREGVSKDRAEELISEKGASIIKYFESIHVYHVRLESGQEVEDAVREFSLLPEVVYAEPNYKVKLQDKPAVPGNGIEENRLSPPVNRDDTGTAPEDKPGDGDTDKKKIEPAAPDAGTDTGPHDIDAPLTHVIAPDATDQDSKADSQGISSAAAGTGPGPLQDAAEPPKPPESSAGEQKEEGPVPSLPEVPVREILPDTPQAPDVTHTDIHPKDYIQVGAWLNIKYAIETLNRLKKSYPDVYLIEEGNFSKVRIPGTMNRRKDDALMKDLREKFNLKPIIVRNLPRNGSR